MQNFVPQSTGDFELLDSGMSMRLEKWGQYTLSRPDPQAIWQPSLPKEEWEKADAVFDDGWKIKNKIQQPWVYKYNLSAPIKASGHLPSQGESIRLFARLTAFKHTGIFPEQAYNWQWLSHKLKAISYKLKILNLFAYTGATTCLLASLGCQVTHVDASKPSIEWAKNNAKLNNLPEDSIRWILDDAAKFVKREIRRGAEYDGIIMDPPAFGHSPSGKTWKFSENLPELLSDCIKLLSPHAQFLIINAYATNTSSIALQNLLEDSLPPPLLRGGLWRGGIESGELLLEQKNKRLLSTGILARWSKHTNHN